jgi:DNA repair protein SbcC/Rad50
MRANYLKLTDFGSYASAVIPLRDLRAAAVIGPNGGGKSTLFKAIDYALFGPDRLRQEKLVRRGAEELGVEFEFAVDGRDWRVVRKYSLRGGGTIVCDLTRMEAGEWVAEASGAAAVTERILDVLGTDRETLRMSAFVGQRQSAEFFDARPARRHEKFGGILRLDAVYDPLEAFFKARAKKDTDDLEEARRDVERLEAEVSALEGREFSKMESDRALGAWMLEQTAAQRALEVAETKADEAATKAEAGRASILRAQAAADARKEREVQATSIRARLCMCPTPGSIDESEATARHDLSRVEALTALEVELLAAKDADAEQSRERALKAEALKQCGENLTRISEDLRKLREDRDAAATEEANTGEQLADLELAELPECFTCGQAIGGGSRERTLAALRAKVEEARARRQDLEDAIGARSPQLAAAREERERIITEAAALPPSTFDAPRLSQVRADLIDARGGEARLATAAAARERRRTLEADLEAATRTTPEAEAEYAQLEREAANAAALGAIHTEAVEAERRARRAVEDSTAKVRALEVEIAGHAEALKFLAGYRAQLHNARLEATRAEVSLERHNLLAADFGKWGVRSTIVLTVLDQLTAEINQVLDLYDCGMAVRFEGAKEVAGGQRDSLEIMVRDPNGYWDVYETYSGGEKYRVESAMHFGLAALLASRSRARIETLILDEPEGLDVAGQRRLAEIVMRKSAQFGLILLLSHYEDLKEAMPQQLLVSRGEDGTSAVEVAA